MIAASATFSTIPEGLRTPLLSEYQSIVQNFMEHRWLPSELSGGRFSEIVYTILDGHANNFYSDTPNKPKNFVQACRNLENCTAQHVPRSFKILIPRVLLALYEIRNNRSVGHVGGDVDPNRMDSVAVLSMCNWVMGELVRVYHKLSVAEAQKIVDSLAEVRIPIVWDNGDIKRVLQPALKLPDKLLLLIASSVPDVTSAELIKWTEVSSKKYCLTVLRQFHKKRYIEFSKASGRIQILPPGTKYVQTLVYKKNLSSIMQL